MLLLASGCGKKEDAGPPTRRVQIRITATDLTGLGAAHYFDRRRLNGRLEPQQQALATNNTSGRQLACDRALFGLVWRLTRMSGTSREAVFFRVFVAVSRTDSAAATPRCECSSECGTASALRQVVAR